MPGQDRETSKTLLSPLLSVRPSGASQFTGAQTEAHRRKEHAQSPETQMGLLLSTLTHREKGR